MWGGGGGWSQGKLGKAGKSLISQAARSTTCWQNTLFAKNRSFLEEEEGNGAASGAAEGRGAWPRVWGVGRDAQAANVKNPTQGCVLGQGSGSLGPKRAFKREREKKKILFISHFCKLSWKGTENRCVCPSPSSFPAEAAGLGAHRELCFPKLDVDPPFPAFVSQV